MGPNLFQYPTEEKKKKKLYVSLFFSGVCHLTSGKEDSDLISVSLCVHKSMPRNSYRLIKCTQCIVPNNKNERANCFLLFIHDTISRSRTPKCLVDQLRQERHQSHMVFMHEIMWSDPPSFLISLKVYSLDGSVI